MYRERHASDCPTNGRSALSTPFDEQIGHILTSIEICPDWTDRIARNAISDYQGPSAMRIRDRLRKLENVYLDSEMSDAQYRHRKADLQRQLQAADLTIAPTYNEAAELLTNLDLLWKEATAEERSKFLTPLVERVYVDLELKRIGAICPTPGFRALLQNAVERSESDCVLISDTELSELGDWSWWRRGGVEPPVQKKNVKDLLQAYPGI